MDTECPNCGEPIDEDARVCPHCGSDEETGWKPDLDYWAVELPEEGLDEDDEVPLHEETNGDDGRAQDGPGSFLVAGAVAAFVGAGFATYGWWILIPLGFLAACAFVFAAGSRAR